MTIPENALLPVAPGGQLSLPAANVAARLARFSRLYQGAMAPATVRAVRGDWQVYAAWCKKKGYAPLAIGRDELIGFFENAIARSLRRATLDRYLFTIRLAHSAAQVEDPTRHPEWRLMWKALVKQLRVDGRNRKRPARPLRQQGIATIVTTLTETRDDLRALRDAALLCLASDTLVRRQELARVLVEELKIIKETGAGVLEVPFSKTDKEGHGMYRYVSPETVAHIAAWQHAAGIERGPLFRAVLMRRAPGESTACAVVSDRAMLPQEVARIFRRRAAAAGLDATRISGHSTRVGSAHDLHAMGYTGTQIARVGGWADETQPANYVRELEAEQTAMADARQRNPLPAPGAD